MKRIIVSAVIISAFTFSARAQSMYDAITLGTSRYFGTARTIGMGNAVTAVGGDIGSIGINPAGSAVAGYSQFVITPGVTVSSVESSYAPSRLLTENVRYGAPQQNRQGRFMLPNVGMSFRFDTGNRSGIKSWTFAFVSNMANNYNELNRASGSNTRTSFAGATATNLANAYVDRTGELVTNPLLKNPWNSKYPYSWSDIAGYVGGMVNYNKDYDNGDGSYGMYYGSNEVMDSDGKYTMPFILNQASTRITQGSKNDLTMNLGFNVNDNLFLGFNLSFPRSQYQYTEIFTEAAQNSEDFWVTPRYIDSYGVDTFGNDTHFESDSYRYIYTVNATGVNAGLGFIFLPTTGLRIGASIKTPTAFTLTDNFSYQVNTNFKPADSQPSAYKEADPWKYEFRSPWGVNAGLAYTFGTYGMLSADYEMTDFSHMRYSEQSSNGYDDYYYSSSNSSAFTKVNRINSLFCGVSHSLRVGAEVRALPYLSIRAGYNLTTSPEIFYEAPENFTADTRRTADDTGKKEVYADNYSEYYNSFEGGKYMLGAKHYLQAPVMAYSLGLGYVSTGSFFADFAVRLTSYPREELTPYKDYLSDAESPRVASKKNVFDAVLTFGWRF